MPSQQSHASIFQDDNYFFTGDLVVPLPQVVIRRAINMASISSANYPYKAITFDNPDGNSGTPATDILEGMTVKIYHQNTSTVKGYLRVAYGGSTSTVMQVNEFNQFDVDIADNDRFEVLREWTLWDILVAASEDFEKDSRRSYIDEGEEMPPVANSGGPYANFVNPTTGLMTVDFWGDESFKIPQVLSTTLTHLWTFGAGCTPTTSTSANPSGVTIPAGQRVISHKVTDANGKSTTQYNFVAGLERTGSNAPYPVRMETLEGEDIDGWVATFSMPLTSLATISNMPYGSLILYIEREYRGGSLSSYGSDVPGRSHIKFVGYLDTESIKISLEENTLTFEARGPLSMLEQIPALPQLLLNDPTPDNWQEIKELNIWIALWYILYWGSTFNLIHDFYWPDGNSFAYNALDVQGATIAEQLRDIARSINVEIRCNRLGQMILTRNVNQLTDTERDARTVTYDLTSEEYLEVSWDQKHRRSVRLVQGEGIKFGDQPVFAWAPGRAPGRGWVSENLDKQILTNEDDLINRVKHRAAEIEGTLYIPSTKSVKLVPQGVEVRILGTMDVFDVGYGEYIKLILPASTNKRGVSFDSNDRFKLKSVRIEYDLDSMSKIITLVLDHETRGVGGQLIPKTIITPPSTPNYDDVDFDYGEIVTVPPVYGFPTITVGIGANRLLAFGTSGPYAARALSDNGFTSFTAGSLWQDISSGLSGQVTWASVDPFDFNTFYVLTTGGLFKGKPGEPTFAGWTQIATNLQMWGNATYVGSKIVMSINRRGTGVLISSYAYCLVENIHTTPTFDLKTTFGGPSNAFEGVGIDICYSPYGGGRMYLSVDGYNGVIFAQSVRRSDDWGQTWPVNSGIIADSIHCTIVVPNKRLNGTQNVGDSSQQVFVHTTHSDSYVRYSVNAGVSYPNISAQLSQGWEGTGRTYMVFDENPNIQYAIAQQGGGLNYNWVYKTIDAGLNWTLLGSTQQASRPNINFGHHPNNSNFVLVFVSGRGGAGVSGVTTGWNNGGATLYVTFDGVTNIDLVDNLLSIVGGGGIAYAQIF